MADSDRSPAAGAGDTPESSRATPVRSPNKHVCWNMQTSELGNVAEHDFSDDSSFEFPPPSPDLVIGSSSPNVSNGRTKMLGTSSDTPRACDDTVQESEVSDETCCLEASFELPYKKDEAALDSFPVLGINVGSTGRFITVDGVDFIEDAFYSGGEVVVLENKLDNEEGFGLYQTARSGNFCYFFESLESGDYLVDLYLSEIILTEGPPGFRVFDVFIQGEKVASDIDIYAKVGANHPMVVPNLRGSVCSDEGLTIRFEGVIGFPIVCGISIMKDLPAGKKLHEQFVLEDFPTGANGDGFQELCKKYYCNCDSEKEILELQRKYILLCKEQTETKKTLEEVKKLNKLKDKECIGAWVSVKELQNELLRKSMHVGSLAFAVEGQVKEKSKWFMSLQEVAETLKVMKSNYISLSEEAMECKKCVADFRDMVPRVHVALTQKSDLEKQHEDLKFKFSEVAKERKELYNKVLELKGNIRVFCRCRPLNAEEVEVGTLMPIDFESAKDGELVVKSNGGNRKAFKFDAVFGPEADQAKVFEDTAPFATSVLDGFNVCIFAYGQTGTGKTFTMEGTQDARGVNYRTLQKLFEIIDERKGDFKYEVSVNVLEVYNEQIRDLLACASQPGTIAKRLEVRQVAGVNHVPGLVEAKVNNMDEVWEVLQTGTNGRAVGSTNANEHSSRSHCIHCVMVKGQNLLNNEFTSSKLWLVDLAGSERIAKTEVQGDRLKEAQNINRSLSALGDVIAALSNKNAHIPFRNSKLTHLLQDSLGGDSKALMFVQISPNEDDMGETLSSLNFASRVRGVELGAARKQVDISEFSKCKLLLERANQEIKSKDEQIKKLEEAISNLEQKVKTRDVGNRTLQDKVKELESQLLVERRLARQHVDTKIAEQHQQEDQLPAMKPPLGSRQLGGAKQVIESTSLKDLINAVRPLTVRPLTDSNKTQLLPPVVGNFTKGKYIEKENKLDATEFPLLRRTARSSFCTVSQNVPATPIARRRNSFMPIPMPSSTPTLTSVATRASLLPPPLPRAFSLLKKDIDTGGVLEMTPWNPKAGTRSSKINNILRRSIQKKIYIKSPLPLHRSRRMEGLEKVRYSFGTQGRTTQRVLVAGNNRALKEKRVPKEKERAWNFGKLKTFV